MVVEHRAKLEFHTPCERQTSLELASFSPLQRVAGLSCPEPAFFFPPLQAGEGQGGGVMTESPKNRSSRRLTIKILRHNPQDPESEPRFESYEIDEAPGMTLFIALNQIRDEQAPSLQFDFVCRAGICGSCGMLINGRPGWPVAR